MAYTGREKIALAPQIDNSVALQSHFNCCSSAGKISIFQLFLNEQKMDKIRENYESDTSSDAESSSTCDDGFCSRIRTDTDFYLKFSGQKSFCDEDDWPEAIVRPNIDSTSSAGDRSNQNSNALTSGCDAKTVKLPPKENDVPNVQSAFNGVNIDMSAPSQVLAFNSIPKWIQLLSTINAANTSVLDPSQFVSILCNFYRINIVLRFCALLNARVFFHRTFQWVQ